MSDLQEQLKEIKTQLRLSMNGKASRSMREKGLNYTLNFGVELPRLKEMAAGYTPDGRLAGTLWKEEIRECKILATLLQPAETFLQEVAEIWIENIPNPEIAEHACKNLFCKTSYALPAALQWIARTDGFFAYCGYLVSAHLFMSGVRLNERNENELIDQAFSDLQGSDHLSRKGAFTALGKYAAQGKEQAQEVTKPLVSLKPMYDEELKGMINELLTIKKEIS